MTNRSLLLDTMAQFIFWLMIAMSIWVLLRGHNEPGGGFIAALIAISATSLLIIVYGDNHAMRYMPLPPLTLTGCGLLLALLSGIPGLVSDDPFLTHSWWSLELGDSSLKISTVLLFDLGVYATVWGAFTIYLLALLNNKEEIK